jgi:hypothetical protein
MKYLLYVFIIVMATTFVVTKASAHEMVPTYPKLVPSFMDGLYKTTMTMFNKRKEIEYYEIGVFDSEWNPIPFVSNYQIYKIPYLTTMSFDVFIRKSDKDRVTYICSKSKLRKVDTSKTAISSRICSKVKG